ncbi:hypothetical protein KDL30_14880 [bacterium]|nr:hypothetical protein [bacterium]
MKIKLSFFAMMISVCMTAGCGGLGSGAANNISQDTLHSAELEDQHTGEMGIILDDAIREIEEFTPTESFDDDLMHELKSALIAVLRENSTDRYVSQKSVNAISDLHIWRDQPGNQDYRISWTYENIGDYDLNGEVNVADLTRIAVYFNAKIGDPNWSSARVADGDGNGEVNISDVTPIGVHFKNFIGSYRIEGTMADGSETWTVVETVDRSDVLKDDPALEIDYELNQPGYDKYRAMSIDSKGRIQRESNTDYIIKLTGKAILLGPDSGNLFDRYTNGWYYVELEGSNEAITEESIVFGGGSTGSSENGFIVDVEEVEILDSNSLRFRGSSVDVNKVINDGYWDLVLPLRGNNVFGNGKGVSRISPVRVEDFAKIRESMTNDPLVIDFSDTSLYEDQFLSIYLSNARLEITPDVYCRVDKFLGVPYELEMSAAGEVSLDLDINADVDIQGEYSPEPIEIPSPPPVPWSLGPVFGDLDLNLYVGATVNGQVQAEATTGFDATSSFSIGADWRSGRQPAWVSSADVTSSFNYHPLTIVATAEGFVQLYLIIELQARVWKVGPNFSVKPFTQLDCELSYPPLEGNAELSWATDVCAGFDFELFELEFEYEKCFNVIPLQHIEYWEFVDEPTTFVAEGYVYEDDGTTPLSGVTMSFTGGHASVQTNGSGYWLRDGLSNGSYTVTPAKSGWTFSPAERSFSIDGSDRTVGSFLGAQEVILHSAEGYVYEDDRSAAHTSELQS